MGQEAPNQAAEIFWIVVSVHDEMFRMQQDKNILCSRRVSLQSVPLSVP